VARSRLAEQVGRVVGGRYRLLAPVGTGASADVYVADDVTLRRRVAVKLLHDALATDEGFLKRFRAEARTVASLRHQNIMAVFDWGEEPEGPFLVLEYLSGGSLRDLLDRGHRLTPSQATLVGLEAARGLDHAHRRGLVHRDIKPANLLFDDEGRLAIADFGIARALAEATWTEPAGAVIGTARYASPEQARGTATDGRADVYALALVLVEAVTGSVPFAADSTIATLMARLDSPIPAGEVLAGLAPVIQAAGAVDPGDRIDAAGMIRAFEAAATTLPRPAALPLAPAQLLPVVPDEIAKDATTFAAVIDPTATVDAVYDQTAVIPVATPLPDPTMVTGIPAVTYPVVTYPLAPTPAESALPPKKAKRRRWRYPWIAVIVVLVALAVAVGLLATPLLHAKTYLVPDFRHRPYAGLVAPPHFKLAENQVYQGTPENTVLSQSPLPGKHQAGTITLTVSVGFPLVQVPNLSGLTPDQLAAKLSPFALTYTTTPGFSTTVPANHVISWTPTGTVQDNVPIKVTISNGPEFVSMPDVTNQTAAAATATLASAGITMTPVQVQQFSDTVPTGEVISTDPPAGGQADRAAAPTLNVSKGPDLVAVPNVEGERVKQAETKLQAAGFVVGGPYGPSSTVFITVPGPGEKAKVGSTVVLYTA
jgi:beta-lactam-binding protein with PASTA domain/tRNA A-37 threonylcarbamoyl transferase component Bud32